MCPAGTGGCIPRYRSEEHTSELHSLPYTTLFRSALSSAQVHRERNAYGQQHVVIEVECNVPSGNRRVHPQVLRTQQPPLLCRDRRKIDRVGRTHLRLRKSARQFEQNATASAVIGRAVINVIPLGVWIDRSEERRVGKECRSR